MNCIKFSLLLGLFVFFFIFFFGLSKVVFGQGRLQALDLVTASYLVVLQSHGAVHINLSRDITSHQDREGGSELDRCFGGMEFCSCVVEIEVADEGSEAVSSQVPDFNATIVSYTSKYRGGLGTPANIVDLLLQLVFVLLSVGVVSLLGVTFVSANELLGGLTRFSFPNSDSPIVRASEEDGVLNVIPEGVATHLVDGATVTMVHLHVLL